LRAEFGFLKTGIEGLFNFQFISLHPIF